MSTLEKAYRILRAAARSVPTSQGRNHIEAIELHVQGYAEPGYGDPASGVIALGNWNTVTRYVNGQLVTLDEVPSRVGNLLEKIGVELQWCDEWAACDTCGKLVRTQPDSYNWQPSYHLDDDGLTCLDCLQGSAAEYLEGLEGNPRRCNTISAIDPAEHGYVLVQGDFENGFHDGQDADPKRIARALETQGIHRFLFNLDSTGQFDTRFSVYVHESEIGKLDREQFAHAEKDGPSVAGALRSGLADAARKMDALQPGGIKCATIKTDGTADVRVIGPEEFVNGRP